jgi:hypothetical protein
VHPTDVYGATLEAGLREMGIELNDAEGGQVERLDGQRAGDEDGWGPPPAEEDDRWGRPDPGEWRIITDEEHTVEFQWD